MPPQPRHAHVGAYLWVLATLIIIAALLYIFRVSMPAPSSPLLDTQATSAPQGFPAAAPKPTANDLVVSQKGFQYLVAYTSSGFRPKTLAIKKGETIRFANNSTDTIQISYADSISQPLALGDYWEYSIPATTTTQFMYKANGSTGNVTIQ